MKTLGYDSSAAGKKVDGMSSEELAAKYIPPEINECQEKEERGEVGKLDLTDKSNRFRDCLKRAFESRLVKQLWLRMI